MTIGEQELLFSTEGRISTLSVDNIENGNIIYVDGYSIRSSDGRNKTILAGSLQSFSYNNGVGSDAMFREIDAMLIINSTSILLADTGNHCLRLLDRVTLRVTDFAGNCTNRGYKDGVGIKAKLFFPFALVLDQYAPHRTLYFTDNFKHTLRKVDLSTRAVHTIPIGTDIHWPQAITWDYLNNYLIIVTSAKIVKVTTVESSPSSETVFLFADEVEVDDIVSIYHDLFILSLRNKQTVRSSFNLDLFDAKKAMLTPTRRNIGTFASVPLLFREHTLYAGLYRQIVIMAGMSHLSAELSTLHT